MGTPPPYQCPTSSNLCDASAPGPRRSTCYCRQGRHTKETHGKSRLVTVRPPHIHSPPPPQTTTGNMCASTTRRRVCDDEGVGWRKKKLLYSRPQFFLQEKKRARPLSRGQQQTTQAAKHDKGTYRQGPCTGPHPWALPPKQQRPSPPPRLAPCTPHGRHRGAKRQRGGGGERGKKEGAAPRAEAKHAAKRAGGERRRSTSPHPDRCRRHLPANTPSAHPAKCAAQTPRAGGNHRWAGGSMARVQKKKEEKTRAVALHPPQAGSSRGATPR